MYNFPKKYGPPDVTVVETNQLFGAMRNAVMRTKDFKRDLSAENLVAFDPGETTGVCIYEGWRSEEFPWKFPLQLCQAVTKDPIEGVERLRSCLPDNGLPTRVICEDYKVYDWKADSHSWSGMHTSQLIGMIRLMCHQLDIPLDFRMAQQAKAWVTDEKLKQWGVYVAGMRHARDAQRHCLTSLFFG